MFFSVDQQNADRIRTAYEAFLYTKKWHNKVQTTMMGRKKY